MAIPTDLLESDIHSRTSTELELVYHGYYRFVHEFLKSKGAYHRKISFPLFIKPFPEYFDSDIKLMIVGKETYGWSIGENLPYLKDEIENQTIVEILLRQYKGFELGKQLNSPFWQFCRKLNQEFNKSNRAFVWNNISKVDENMATPKWDILKGLNADVNNPIIKTEIEILKPNVIVFLTGSVPESHLRNVFNGLELVPIDKIVYRMVHPTLPYNSYKTQHPKSLRIRKTFDNVIKLISADVKETLINQTL